MSESMRKVRDGLMKRFGERYGRERWAWLMQKYDILPWDDAPQDMINESKS